MELAKSLRIPLFIEHLRWLILKINILLLQLPIYYALEREISIEMRAMRKQLDIFMLQLLNYYILELEISIGTNADIAKTG